MKKILLSLFALSLAVSLKAASVSVVLPTATASNVATLIPGSFRITGVTVTATTTNAPVVNFYDSSTAYFVTTNASYTYITSFATNIINFWTNYYGTTNYTTNLSLIDVTNTGAAATNALAPAFIAIAPTNTTVQYNNLNVGITRGLWITNTVAGASVLTITYSQ